MLKVKSIIYEERFCDVFNLEVNEFHNFIANGVCVKNSSSAPNFQ